MSESNTQLTEFPKIQQSSPGHHRVMRRKRFPPKIIPHTPSGAGKTMMSAPDLQAAWAPTSPWNTEFTSAAPGPI